MRSGSSVVQTNDWSHSKIRLHQAGGGGGSYARYIASRDGVELIEAPAGEGYLAYIAERPRSHGLFSARGVADLEQSMEVLNRHTGPVWTFVYSLRRADAARLG